MEVPMSKAELIKGAKAKYEKMWKLIDTLPEEVQKAKFTFEITLQMKGKHWRRDRNLRDVLAHLYEWHERLIDWLEGYRKGSTKPMSIPPYRWQTYECFNIEVFEKHQITSLDKAKSLLRESHEKVMRIIEGATNEELFPEIENPRTDDIIFGIYCFTVTGRHYEWAIQKIRAQIKAAEMGSDYNAWHL